MTYQMPLQQLDYWCQQQPDTVFLRQPRERQLHDLTWTETRSAVLRLTGALRQLGLRKGDKVAILSKNCAEWFITDLALQAGGFISVPIFPTANIDTIRYVLAHSESKAVFVGKLDDMEVVRDKLPDNLLRFGMGYPSVPVQYKWKTLLEMAPPMNEVIREPDNVMTIIYTSGSTGRPKGTVHTYRTYSWSAHTAANNLGCQPDERVISYLPLAHITERVYIQGTALYGGMTVYFAESLDTFIEDVKVAQPHYFLSVPRLWTLFQKNIVEKVGEAKLNLLLKIPIVKSIVTKKIQAGLGLQSAKILGCGSAPVSASLLEWYRRVGLNITEAWGMTENSAYATLNLPFRADKIGTVGKPGSECEVRTGKNKELEFRSPGLFVEYYKEPEVTKASFTKDGYFKTGDQAKIDHDGYVSITGRVKDTFKTAKGKFVAPVPIERMLAQDIHLELICVIGSGLPYPVALVQLSEGAALLPRDDIRPSLAQIATIVSSKMESHATLGGVLVVTEPWTIENEVLTPTLKIKRHVLEERYSERVMNLRDNQVVWEDELAMVDSGQQKRA